jgi:CRISPR-associated protein Cas2
MFDLPAETGKERKAYRIFRKELIKEGFIMLQYSVYMRTCPSRDYANRLTDRIEKKAPHEGHIRLLMITEKQYEDMKIVIGSKSQTEKALGSERMIKL